MGQNYTPKYDNENITFGYLKKLLGNSITNVTDSESQIINFCKNYGSTPIPPYNEGDTWTTNDKIYKCKKSREIGSFNMSDWTLIYDKTTNEIISNNFLFLSSVKLIDSSDNKIETFSQYDDPSLNWESNEIKDMHLGDYYQNLNTYKTYIYSLIDNEYIWEEINVTTIIFDSVTGHRNIFLKRPDSYTEGDIWRINNVDDIQLYSGAQLNDFFRAKNTNTEFLSSDFDRITDELSLKANIYSQAGILILSEKLLTNLQYVSSGRYNGYDLLGFNKYYTVSGTAIDNSDLALDVDLPDNFNVVSAYITVFHTPVYWNYWDTDTQASTDKWGYSRNIRLYKMISENNFKLYMAFANEYRMEFLSSEIEEIENAFRETSWNPANTEGTSIEKKTTFNIKSYLNRTGKTKLIIRTGDELPTTDNDIVSKTGMARAVINILGYIDPKGGNI